MKMKSLLFTVLTAFATLTFLACDPKPESKEVPYTELERYFFRNDATIPTNPKIDTREQFDSLFGMAAVMGANGRPTEVDFTKQFVIAVVLPVTNQATELDGERLLWFKDLLGGTNLDFQYSIDRDEDTLSYSMQPILLIAVDRQYDAEKVYLSEVEDK